MRKKLARAALAGVLCTASAGCATGTVASSASEPAKWTLVWADEFDGDRIDRSKWDFDIDCWGGGNNERQCYTDSARNASVEQGVLRIVARREDTRGPAFPPYLAAQQPDPRATAVKPFSSARMVTRGKAAWRYGKIEVRAKLPQGQGTWPAIWMLPEDNTYGGWARSGEIDILEAVNLGVECPAERGCEEGGENTILGTLHFGGGWPDNKFASTEIAYPPVLDQGFHTFGVEWGAGIFVWTVDGVPYATKRAGDWFTTASADPMAPFDQRFHLILNLAIGGGLAEGRAQGGVDESGYPKTMEVDWVRVWQCAPGNVRDEGSGTACIAGSDE
ncbi:glycoside hydrolase family 16 protein [Parerythrobacter aurantius]|uniref:glycoside hydrolase family 16 protein n=1 Tax=Parerythrobacter aurantius TaxID=3127706 RepID=UPI003246D91C